MADHISNGGSWELKSEVEAREKAELAKKQVKPEPVEVKKKIPIESVLPDKKVNNKVNNKVTGTRGIQKERSK